MQRGGKKDSSPGQTKTEPTRDSKDAGSSTASVPAATHSGGDKTSASSSSSGSSAPPPLDKAIVSELPFDAANAKQQKSAWAKQLNQPVELTSFAGGKLVLIPPGKFQMGSSTRQTDDAVTQIPNSSRWLLRTETQKEAVIAEPFWLGATEITVAEFRAFVEATSYKTTAERDGKGGERPASEGKLPEAKPEHIWSHPDFAANPEWPVVCVTLSDAKAFCDWLGEKDGRNYFIPSESQWEYACRAGATTQWYWGDEPVDAEKYAVLSGRSPAATKQRNHFGLYDMLGNVAEIAVAGDGAPIWRGGSANGAGIWFARSAAREPRAAASYLTGFRIAAK